MLINYLMLFIYYINFLLQFNVQFGLRCLSNEHEFTTSLNVIQSFVTVCRLTVVFKTWPLCPVCPLCVATLT